MYIELVRQFNDRKKKIWQDFLKKAGLEPDFNITQTALLWDEDILVAVGSRNENLFKCIAVEQSRQGEDLASKVLSVLRQEAFSDGYNHLFLYTKPENENLFSTLFFYTVAKTEKVILMENRRNGIKDYLDSMPISSTFGEIGAIVMNCNPFTLGHRYLIETAAKDCDHLCVFVVSENKSRFSFEERLQMVKFGTADIDNVSVLSTGPYLVSSATFPTYFLKEYENIGEIQCLLDIEIFAKYFVPKFCIKSRYVGTEPFSQITNQYNKALKANLPKYGVSLKEISRKEISGTPVSASQVRRLIDEGNIQEIREIVPDTTFNFLKTHGHI